MVRRLPPAWHMVSCRRVLGRSSRSGGGGGNRSLLLLPDSETGSICGLPRAGTRRSSAAALCGAEAAKASTARAVGSWAASTSARCVGAFLASDRFPAPRRGLRHRARAGAGCCLLPFQQQRDEMAGPRSPTGMGGDGRAVLLLRPPWSPWAAGLQTAAGASGNKPKDGDRRNGDILRREGAATSSSSGEASQRAFPSPEAGEDPSVGHDHGKDRDTSKAGAAGAKGEEGLQEPSGDGALSMEERARRLTEMRQKFRNARQDASEDAKDWIRDKRDDMDDMREVRGRRGSVFHARPTAVVSWSSGLSSGCVFLCTGVYVLLPVHACATLISYGILWTCGLPTGLPAILIVHDE